MLPASVQPLTCSRLRCRSHASCRRSALHTAQAGQCTSSARRARCSWHRVDRFTKPRRVSASSSAAATDALDPESSTSSSQAPGPPSTAAAVYVRRALAAGDAEDHSSAVVVLGDVPQGARVVSQDSDVIITGMLAGEAHAGSSGNRDSIVVASALAASASIRIAGVKADAVPAGAGRMAVLEPGATAVAFKALPGTLPAPEEGKGITASLGQLGGALVLLLGLGLAIAPATVLGSLLSTSAESATAALLEVCVYGYILLQGATLLGDGSELLLEILDPGIIGGVVLPVLGALPDSLIILTSGLSGTLEEAREQVAVGVGTLAGSTILLLSLAWGGSVVLGRCDLDEQGRAIDKTLTRGWDLQRTGTTTDDDVRKGAVVMAASVLLYGIVQVPAFMGDVDDPQAALFGSIACITAFVGYCGYSVLSPELQKRRIDSARKKRFRMYAVQALALKTDNSKYGGLLDDSGRLNRDAVATIFDEFDRDNNGVIEASELQALLMGLQLSADAGGMLAKDKESHEYLFKELDVNKDASITKEEFKAVLGRWVGEKLTDGTNSSSGGSSGSSSGRLSSRLASRFGNGSSRGGSYSALVDPAKAQALLVGMPNDDVEQLQAVAAELEGESKEDAEDDMEEDGSEGGPLTSRDIAIQATLKLGAGIALCAVFSDPLVEALTNLSRATGIPPFFAGFILTPLASNASEFLSSLRFAARKRRKSMSLTLSQVYGAVTMNNTLVLGLFLLVVSLRGLDWVYSSEVTVIVAATIAVGALGYSRSTFQTAWALPVIAIYPASLITVQLLDSLLGWQ